MGRVAERGNEDIRVEVAGVAKRGKECGVRVA